MIAAIREQSQSLTVRIAALLALALLPIGFLSVATTMKLVRNLDLNAEASILALTAKAAAPEEASIRSAIGAAKMFAALVPGLNAQGLDCSAPLQEFILQSNGFSFAGYVDENGDILCASTGQGLNMMGRPVFEQMIEDPKPRVSVAHDTLLIERSAIVVSEPVYRDGAFAGFVSVTFPHGHQFMPMEQVSKDRPIDLITYNADAEILTASGGIDTAGYQLPANIELERLARGGNFAFIDYTREGNLRVFAIVPIVENQVYALGSWSHKREDLIAGISLTSSVLFPVAMWIACLGVGFFAVQRMVIRPTRELRARMLYFMRSRRLEPARADFATPRELREMEATWTRLAENVLHDEGKLHDTIKQRTVLLKEVHHRVKNNLQLIVSILNMKVRKAQSPEEQAALSEIRQRVMGISRVHQNLYETSTAEQVHAGELLSAIVGETVRSTVADPSAIEFHEDYQDVVIYPDQAVPLSLAVTELLTNALKNMGTPKDGGDKPMLSVRLLHEGAGSARFQLCNSVAGQRDIDVDLTSSGLGLPLIKAFAQQINGRYEAGCTDDIYSAALHFPIAEFEGEDVPETMPLSGSSGWCPKTRFG